MGFKSEPRGKDSWGALLRYEKLFRPFHGLGAFRSRENKKKLKDTVAKSYFMAGHTRQATHGSVTLQNCHPFTMGRFVMSHNGVLNDAKYKKETLLLPKGETDSEAFLAYIVSTGKDVTAFLDADSTYGGSAFQIYDTETDDLYIANVGRDLHYYEDEKIVVWASESIVAESAYAMVFNKPIAHIVAKALGDFSNAELIKVGGNGVRSVKRQALHKGSNYRGHTDWEDWEWEGNVRVYKPKHKKEEPAKEEIKHSEHPLLGFPRIVEADEYELDENTGQLIEREKLP